jgi:type IV pilus assembly protein PilA
MRKTNARAQSGFTLTELIITIVVLIVLASVAIPSFLHYTRRAYYKEIILLTEPFKTGVAQCYQKTADLRVCDGGSHGIPINIATPKGAVAMLTVTNGIITAIPVAARGVTTADTYILKPTIVNNNIVWKVSGGAVTAGYVK